MYSNLSHTGSAPRYHNQHRRSCTPSTLPQPTSAPNSLRSAQLSLRSANNSTLLRNSMVIDSIPIDTMMSDNGNNAEILKDKSKVPINTIVDTKVSTNILPIFILESLSLVCLASLAYFLRFTDSFGVLIRGFFCDDQTISYPFEPTFGKNATPVMTGFSNEVFYSSTIGIPVLMIIVCEIIRMLFMAKSTPKKVIAAHTGCITCRIHLVLRRIFRFIGGFFYGLLMTSIITDTLKLVTGRLRPYFLNVCQSITDICRTRTMENITNEFDSILRMNFAHKWINPNEFNDENLCQNETSLLREARMSFPSSTASITSFSAFFIILYVSFVITFRSGHIIRLWFSASALISLLIIISGKVTTHQNHVEDVIVSLIIGILFALYVCYTQLNFFRDKTEELSEEESPITLTEEEENAWFWKYFHIPRVNLLRRSARYFRKRDDNTINVVRSNGSAYVNPAFEHKEYEQKEIIDNNRRASGYHDDYRH